MKEMIYIVCWCIWVAAPCPDANVYDEFGRYLYTTDALCEEQKYKQKKFLDKDSAFNFMERAERDLEIQNVILDSMTWEEHMFIKYPVLLWLDSYGELYMPDSLSNDVSEIKPDFSIWTWDIPKAPTRKFVPNWRYKHKWEGPETYLDSNQVWMRFLNN